MTPLQTEISTGPLAAELAPFVLSGSDVDVARILNDNTRGETLPAGISRDAFALFAGQTGLRAAIEDNAANVASPMRSVALTLLDFLRGGISETLRLNSPQSQAMAQPWVSTGAITQTQMETLTALGTRPASRAEISLGREVTQWDVARALFKDNGARAI